MKTLNKFLEQAQPAQEPQKEDPKLKQDQKKENMLKKRVLMTKMRAVRGGATGIMASHEPEGELVEASAVLDANTKIKSKEQREKDKKELASLEKKAKLMKKYGSSFHPFLHREGVMKFIKSVGRKKTTKKASMDKTTEKLHDWRQKNSDEQKEREKYVSPFRPIVKEGKGYQPEIEHSKLGDAKKKADKKRESKLPPHLQGDAIGKMRKAFATEEDKAFNFVLDKIRKEVGKDGYVSKDNPRKPQSAADKAKARAHQAKVDKENAAERKKDPSQGRYPKG